MKNRVGEREKGRKGGLIKVKMHCSLVNLTL